MRSMALTGPNLGKVVSTTNNSKALAKPYVGPFPNFPRPSSEECRAVKAALERLHGPIERLSGSDQTQSLEAVPVLRLEGPKSDRRLDGSNVKTVNVEQVVPLADEKGGVLRKVKEEIGEDTRAGMLRNSEVLRDLGTPEAVPSKRLKFSSLVPEGRIHVKEEQEPDVLCARDAAEASPSELESIGEERQRRLIIPADEMLTGCGDVRKVEEDENAKRQGAVPQELLHPPGNVSTPRRLLRSQAKKGQTGELKAETAVKSESGVKEKTGTKRKKRKPEITTPGITVKPNPPITPQHQVVKREASDFPLSQTSELPPPLTPVLLRKPNPEEPRTPVVQEVGSADRMSVLDSLVRTILSQNTTDKNSQRAFESLKQAFPNWEDVREAGQGPLAASIKSGGLAEIKARRILDILDSLAASHGALELEHLRFMSDEEVKAELSQFKGVGPKTVACVLMFCLDRHEFPVDTHVWRISKRLGWVPQNADREATYLHLNQRVPDDVKYDLHCLLVGHGKKCPGCAKGGRPQRAPDGPCPLTPWIRGSGKGEQSIAL